MLTIEKNDEYVEMIEWVQIVEQMQQFKHERMQPLTKL